MEREGQSQKGVASGPKAGGALFEDQWGHCREAQEPLGAGESKKTIVPWSLQREPAQPTP